MPSAVIEAMTNYRAQLDAQERAASTRMAAAWLDATRGLDGDMERLAMQLSNAATAGRPVRRWHVLRMERYQSLMRQMGGQLREYAPVAVEQMQQQQQLMARWGIEHAEQLVNVQTPGITGQFDRLPLSAVQNMVGNAGDGTPLGQLLRASWGQQAPDVAGALVRGVALGWHPSRTAQAMRQAANVPLERAIVIARTESLRVYREASRQSYQRSGLVSGYMRIAAKSVRTCMACLLSDGQFYPLDVPFEEHVQGRCQAIPRVKGAAPIEFERGPQWFARQDAATQRAMLGAGRFDAWQSGKFDLSDVVARVENDTWGASLQVRSLAELVR